MIIIWSFLKRRLRFLANRSFDIFDWTLIEMKNTEVCWSTTWKTIWSGQPHVPNLLHLFLWNAEFTRMSTTMNCKPSCLSGACLYLPTTHRWHRSGKIAGCSPVHGCKGAPMVHPPYHILPHGITWPGNDAEGAVGWCGDCCANSHALGHCRGSLAILICWICWISPSLHVFSWEFTTKINNVEITDLHMLHPCVPWTQERNFGSTLFSFGVQMFGNRNIALSRCSGGWVRSN